MHDENIEINIKASKSPSTMMKANIAMPRRMKLIIDERLCEAGDMPYRISSSVRYLNILSSRRHSDDCSRFSS